MRTVCDECPRRRPRGVKRLRRSWKAPLDRTHCLLEQGLVCCGLGTSAGCGALCIRYGSPCIGCYGLAKGGEDFGAGMISALAAVVDRREPDEVERLQKAGIGDPAAVFHRYRLAHGLMRRRVERSLHCSG